MTLAWRLTTAMVGLKVCSIVEGRVSKFAASSVVFGRRSNQRTPVTRVGAVVQPEIPSEQEVLSYFQELSNLGRW